MPNVDPAVIEALAQEAGVGRDGLAPISDEAAAEVVDKARRQVNLLRHEESEARWFLMAVWIIGATLATLYFEDQNPVAVWYEWSLVGIGGAMLVGIALTVVYGVTVLLHDLWWNRFGGGAATRNRAAAAGKRR